MLKHPTGDLNPEPQDTFAPLFKSGLEVLRDIRFRQQGKKYINKKWLVKIEIN